jgi:uncharacterized protein (TIGR03546 family)
MLLRSIGGVLRGRGTPVQFMIACILGGMLGFVPGFSQAPGLIVALTLLLIVLNANLFLALAAGLVAKALALVSLPVSFLVGRALLDGPTQSLFKKAINAPVLAFFGFEYYAVTGGLLIGLIVGVTMGLGVVVGIRSFRRRMSGVEEDSERYQKWTGKWYVKLLLFVFAGGGKGKRTYADLLEKKVGNPVRPLGVVFAALVIGLLFVVKALFTDEILTAYLRGGLETVNGASVDVESTQVDLGAGKLVVSGLAMADPEALDTDLFRARRLEAQISTSDLLRKRLQMDRLVVDDASHGEKRKTPGRLAGRRTPPPAEPPKPGEKTLEDYLQQAQLWKQRITQAKEWLDKLSGPAQRPDEPKESETLKQRLERQIQQSGYARVKATHLIEGSPTFTLAHLEAIKVRAVQLNNETLDITASNLSTHPHLLAGAPRVMIKSAAGTLDLDLTLGGAAMAPSENTIKLAYRGLPVDSFAAGLKIAGAKPIQGGTIDLVTHGGWTAGPGGAIELPLQVTLYNTSFALPGMAAPQRVEKFLLPIGVRGPASSPRIAIDDERLAKSLLDAGISQVTARARDEADKLKSQAADRVNQEGSKLLGNLLGGDSKKTEDASEPRQPKLTPEEKARKAEKREERQRKAATKPAR